MNTQLVILFALFALGSVLGDVYFVGRQARGQVLRFQSSSVVRRFGGLKVNLAVDDTDGETETDTDTDTETEVVAASASPIPKSPSPSAPAASPSAPAASPSAPAASPSAPAASPSAPAASASAPAASPSAPAASPSAPAASASPAAASPSRAASSSPQPEQCAAGQQLVDGKCVRGSVSGKLKLPGTAADYGTERLDAISGGLASTANVDKSFVKCNLAKDTVTVVFVIYLPASATTVTLDSITASLNDNTALLAAINQALASAGYPTVDSIIVAFDPSSSPTPSTSPSASVVVEKADSKDDKSLGDGAIAGIVIGSVVGAAALVGLIVFFQMRTTRRAHARSSSKLTAQAVEAEAAKGGKNSLDAQF